jgi:FMN phosphatase YigB (HAD superfamily)
MKIQIKAAEIAALLDRAPDRVKVLSLDCFDTLIWRNVQAPTDVFCELGLAGGGAWMRGRAEGRARQRVAFDGGENEVSIEQIYRSLRPSASDDEIDAMIAAEFDAEARHCYAFAPTVDLIRAARAKGLKVIIVSDTYLSEPQLRALIATAAGEDVIDMIDRIFCSSDFGMGKSAGLFGPVIEALGVPAREILHVGDNRRADQIAPSALGIATAHFRQFDSECEQRLRLEAAAATLLDPLTRVSVPALQPHRPQLSLRTEKDPVWALGHDVLGPLMHAFADWVRAEAEALAATTGKAPKVVFLLRDGHLPQRAYEAAFGPGTAAAEISRFTARRASFTDAGTIRTYLASQAKHERIAVLARQLGLSREEGEKLGRGGQDAFNKAALVPANVRKIVERSSAFADKLFAHLQRQGVERGDTVMLVDLGYNGTVQNHVEPVLRDRFGLAVAGRYLLLREEEETGFDKTGFLDVRHYDTNALHALCGPIAVIEQLCTLAQGSVENYGPTGEPFRKGAGAKGAQNAIRDRIQVACVAYASNASAGVHRPPVSDTGEARRRMAAGILARLLFMPTATEVGIFEAFDHDVNLGTDDHVPMLDVERSGEGLRRRGFLYLNGVERMYLPGELQPHGLPLNLSLFSANRFGLDLRGSDFRCGALKLSVILASDSGQTMVEIEAHATHDGYYLATVPVGAGRFAAGIQFGALCDWVQIDEAVFYPVAGFNPGVASDECKPIAAPAVREGMTEESAGLFRCEPGGLLLVPPAAGLAAEPHLLALTFRPLVLKDRAALRKAA